MANRGLPPDGDQIAFLRNKKGLTQEELAKQTALKVEAIQRMEKGVNTSSENLELVALELLGTKEINGILKKNKSDADLSMIDFEIKYFEIQIKISIPYDQFDSMKASWLQQLAETIVSKYDIRFKHAVAGSTVLILEMSGADAMRLIIAFMGDRLAAHKIKSINVGGEATGNELVSNQTLVESGPLSINTVSPSQPEKVLDIKQLVDSLSSAHKMFTSLNKEFSCISFPPNKLFDTRRDLNDLTRIGIMQLDRCFALLGAERTDEKEEIPLDFDVHFDID